ncbi:hypothetical protein SY212_04130 [Ligilactobacillus agilis]|uniref:Uncharacterized protein n=1 Tax=Ligilactobacillus agilis TaxID=1601 RepID=A0A6F9XJE1_9LACO|nr:hypothetical protein [Ligilactobacillus agilis]GET05383.1 hypothetical protein SY212_04130 [Ligilactobacillus agilis]
MEKEIYVVVQNKNYDRCVGMLRGDNNCYFNDYRTHERDVDLETSVEQGQQIIIDYLVKDLPCNPNEVFFVSDKELYDYLTVRVNTLASIFCDRYGLSVSDYDTNGAYIENGMLCVDVKVGDDILVLVDDLDNIIDCKNDKELYREIIGMFIDTVEWFKSNKRLDDLVNASYVLTKENEISKKYME